MRYYIVKTKNGVPIAPEVIRGTTLDNGNAAIETNVEVTGATEITKEQFNAFDNPKTELSIPSPQELQGKLLANLILEVAKINAKLGG